MKKFLIFVLFSVLFNSVSGQQVYMETGVAISAFHYKDSDGEGIENLFGTYNFFIKTGYNAVSKIDRMNISAGLSYARYGARGSDSSVGNYFDWETDYIGIDLGIDYEIVRKRLAYNSLSDFIIYLKAAVTPEIMVHGTQRINNEVYDLRGVEQFKYPFLFARGGAGIKYSAGRLFTIYTEYMGGMGFTFKPGNTGDQEILRISSHNIGLGILVNLPSYRSWK